MKDYFILLFLLYLNIIIFQEIKTECPENCIDKCDENSVCLECNQPFQYGTSCDETCDKCFSGCSIDGKCNIDDKYCKDYLYYGDYCENECKTKGEKCITCDKSGICTSCIGDFTFGEKCEKTCEKCTVGCSMDGKCNGTEYCKDYEPYDITDFKTEKGMGVSAVIDDEQYFCGNLKYLNSNGIDTSRATSAKNTVIYVSNSKEIIGIFTIEDIIKPDSKTAITKLNEMGIKTVLVTGDNKDIAKKVSNIRKGSNGRRRY